MSRKIRSRDNAAFKQLLRITASARERRQLGVSFIEGIHLCDSYLRRFGPPRQVVHTEAALDDPQVRLLVEAAANGGPTPALSGGRFVELAEGLFGELSQVEHGIGIAYVIDTPADVLPAVLDSDAVYLDGLQDPGNVGTILRTCAAVGVNRVITAPGTAWCWSPKVLRAGMGAHFALEIHESVAWEQVLTLLRTPIMATAAQAPRTVWQADLRGPRLWLFGSEGSGLDPDRQGPALQWVSIPQRPAIESLNVAVAAAVCLFEQLRQREAQTAGAHQG
ncbi:MAG TPA: RNA methyltransferase [Burkholderiaceae bacterium]|jgi:TrmH family RNA methyltransferase|nr:RNA methyltransferase [Burkholderiaceae bacterium]